LRLVKFKYTFAFYSSSATPTSPDNLAGIKYLLKSVDPSYQTFQTINFPNVLQY